MPNDIATIDQAGESVTAEVSETASAETATYSVERAVENIGDMNALVGWMNTNLGIFGAQKALQNAAFVLCCDVISQDLAKARMYLRKRLDNRTSRIMEPNEHPVAALLAYRPNPHMTWHEYHEMMMFWLPLTQNAHAIVDRTVVGDPAGLVPIMTSQQHPFVLDERLY
jgi:phage portal protein BeeE